MRLFWAKVFPIMPPTKQQYVDVLMAFVTMNFKARLELITSMATSGCVTRYVTVVRRNNTVDYLPAL